MTEDVSILFIRKKSDRNELCYGPLAGPYKTLYQSSVKSEPSSYSFNEKEMIGEFSVMILCGMLFH